MTAMAEFAGRRAVVTGAATGIGRAIARVFAQRGAAVLAVDHNADVEHLAGDGIDGLVADLADRATLERLADRLSGDPTDILVNCAACYPPRGGFLAAGFDDWQRVLTVNVVALGLLAKGMATGRRARVEAARS